MQFKIKITTWNVNGVKTLGKELSQLIKKPHQDVVILCEARTDARETFDRIWLRTKVEQVVPFSQAGVLTRAAVALVTKPGGEAQLLKRMDISEGEN